MKPARAGRSRNVLKRRSSSQCICSARRSTGCHELENGIGYGISDVGQGVQCIGTCAATSAIFQAALQWFLWHCDRPRRGICLASAGRRVPRFTQGCCYDLIVCLSRTWQILSGPRQSWKTGSSRLRTALRQSMLSCGTVTGQDSLRIQ